MTRSNETPSVELQGGECCSRRIEWKRSLWYRDGQAKNSKECELLKARIVNRITKLIERYCQVSERSIILKPKEQYVMSLSVEKNYLQSSFSLSAETSFSRHFYWKSATCIAEELPSMNILLECLRPFCHFKVLLVTLTLMEEDLNF